MPETSQQSQQQGITEAGLDNLFIIVCSSGFDSPKQARSALMFATLAVASKYRTILFCIQDAVDLMVESEAEKREPGATDSPSIGQRLEEAIYMGVEIQCCTQAMANKGIKPGDLIEGVTPAGGISLIELASHAKGSLCF